MNIYPMNILPNDGSSLASHPTDDTKSEPWPTNLEAVWEAYVTNGDWCWKKGHQRMISFKSSVFNDPSRTRLWTDWCHQSSDTVGWNPSLERPAKKKGCTTKKISTGARQISANTTVYFLIFQTGEAIHLMDLMDLRCTELDSPWNQQFAREK